MKDALAEVTEQELSRLAHVVNRLLAGRTLRVPGHRPDRYRAGYGFEFLDHRAYTAGDNMRDIDWRATARSRQIQVRRYWDEGSSDWFICLDRSASMSVGGSDKWRLGIQCAAAIAYLMIHMDNRVGLILFSGEVDQLQPPGRGPGHYAKLLHLLHTAKPGKESGGSMLASCRGVIRERSPLFVISDFLVEDGMRKDLLSLSRRHHHIQALQILSPADSRVPVAEGNRLHDVESGSEITIDPTRCDPLTPQRELEKFCRGLHYFCKQNQISSSCCDTHQGWKQVVVNHLRKQIPRSA